MYQTHKIFVTADSEMISLINENPALLLLLEHMEIDFTVNDKTVEQICAENKISLLTFLLIANIYNGFTPKTDGIGSRDDISTIIRFLRNSHSFYLKDKYPEIKSYIVHMRESQNSDDMKLIERFFSDYFEEVKQHFAFEDQIVFPYFCSLINQEKENQGSKFSVNEYREHHTDIEMKLTDLKNLLLKHIQLKGDLTVRRKFMSCLYELESDLRIHSLIEEMILVPMVDKIERAGL